MIAYSGLGPRPKPRYRSKPVSLTQHVLAAGRAAAHTIGWREGSKGRLESQFVLLRVRVAGRRPRLSQDGSLPLSWLIAQWPDGEAEPVKYWLSNLPDDTDPATLVPGRDSQPARRMRRLSAAAGLSHRDPSDDCAGVTRRGGWDSFAVPRHGSRRAVLMVICLRPARRWSAAAFLPMCAGWRI
ncbi:hypothetical protein [Micromonospora chersina]|uniref:hypothetical protein n=1 Tax=Micromonospora chersina TaxID=47854 RepID=UPI00371AA1F2